ncbi:MAG: hypothetical protein RQ751_06925 [Longimicrobiales bacterium]|nr:hypothetical protein [Longimicrobiales bacterium]
MDEFVENPWYQLGYALEQARSRPTGDRLQLLGSKLAAFRREGQGAPGARTVSGNGERSPRSVRDSARTRGAQAEGPEGFDWILAALSATLVRAALREWPPRRRPGPLRVLRAGAAGAVAVAAGELAHRALTAADGAGAGPNAADPVGPGRPGALDRILAGAARGLVYGGVAEPRLPGPPALRGILFGGAEFLLSDVGGLGRLLGREAPWARVPLLRRLLDETSDAGDGFVEHVVFGVALALMAGETEASADLR